MQETKVQSLGWEDPLEKELATYSHGQRNLVGYSPRGHTESDTTEQLTLLSLLSLYCVDMPPRQAAGVCVSHCVEGV